MYDVADILAYKVNREGTYLQILLPGANLMDYLAEKDIRKCGLQLEDGRHITPEQRKKAYATIADIARFTGELPEVMKEWMKYYHIARTGCPYFSLADCSVETARMYINSLMDYALSMGVILDDTGVNRTDDINVYLYQCLKHHKCAVCGRDGEVHHWDAVGMGHDRQTYDDSGSRKVCLCREHHTEAHTIGRDAFEEKYHVYGIVVNVVNGWNKVSPQ